MWRPPSPPGALTSHCTAWECLAGTQTHCPRPLSTAVSSALESASSRKAVDSGFTASAAYFEGVEKADFVRKE